MPLPSKYSSAVPIEVVVSGGIPVRQVDTDGVALDSVTAAYSVALPCVVVDSTGAVSGDPTRVYSTWRRVTVSDEGLPIIRVNGSGTSINTSIGDVVSAPVNSVLPVISGTTMENFTLSTTDGTWTNSPTAYTYQWKRDGVAISGAINNTYLLVTADIGATITVTVTATNSGGSTAATSAGVGPVVVDSGVRPTAPILTLTSQPGDNPPNWTSEYTDLILGRDTIRLEWRVNAGLWNQDTDHLVTSDDLINGTWNWPLFSAASFVVGDVVEVREYMIRDAGDPGEAISVASNVLSDTIEDAVPDAFAFTDVTGATQSTLYTSNAITVAGLGTGVAANASVDTGEYSLNGGAWTAAGSFTVVNGDTVAVRQTSSASTSTTTDVILTIGGVSDTYSVTTAGATTLEIARVAGGQTSSSISTFTYSAQALGAEDATRQIIVAVGGQKGVGGTGIPTSVTVAGVSATQVSGVSADGTNFTMGTSLWVATVPTGTTGDIVVTYPATMSRMSFAAYRMVNGNATPASTGNNSDTVSGTTLTASPTIPASSIFIVAGTTGNTGGTISWTNATEDFENYMSGTNLRSFSVAMNSTAGSPVVTMTSGSVNPRVLSWAVFS